MEYINTCENAITSICIGIVLGFLMFLFENNDDGFKREKRLLAVIFTIGFFVIPGILDAHFYKEYSNNETVWETIEIKSIEKKKFRPYSDLFDVNSRRSRINNRKYDLFFLETTTGDEYLIASKYLEDELRESGSLPSVITVEYVKTKRCNVIKNTRRVLY